MGFRRQEPLARIQRKVLPSGGRMSTFAQDDAGSPAAARRSGPRALPFLGHALAVTRDPLGFFADAARHYGDWAPLRIGTRRFYAATHPDLIEEALVAKHRSFRKSPGLRRSSILFGNGLLTSEGDFWRKQRRLIQPAFHRDRIAAA